MASGLLWTLWADSLWAEGRLAHLVPICVMSAPYEENALYHQVTLTKQLKE